MNESILRGAGLEIRILATLLAKLADRDLEQRLAEGGSGLTGLQFRVMQILRREPCTLSDLGRRMIVTPTTLVPVVDALERKGLVERGHDPSDRRRTPLSLTAAGSRLLGDASPAGRTDVITTALESLGPAKAEALRELLREVVAQASRDSDLVGSITAMVERRMDVRQTVEPNGNDRSHR